MQAATERMTSATAFAAQRQTMVDCQIRTFDVTDQRLLASLLAVSREAFVPDDVRELAYSDVRLSVPGLGGEGARHVLPPFVLARLIQGGRVRSTDRVLDVGGALGYSAAVLANIARDVTALEATPDRCREMEQRLSAQGVGNVKVRAGELAGGVADLAPFDVILLNGAVEHGLEGLYDQLAEAGRLLAILRNPGDPTGRAAKAMCFERRNGEIGTRYLFDATAPVLDGFRRAQAFSF